VRHQGPDLLRVPGHQGQRVDRAAAAGEDVHRPGIERGDDPVQVISVLIRRGLGSVVGARAALHPAGIVGHHRAVGEMPGQGDESGGAHRRTDE